VGNAVVRNRIKRRIREAFRLHRAALATQLDTRWDIVLNPRRAVFDAPFDEIEQALGKVMRRCNSC
jgi:ribonuclease P protein component